MLVFKPIRTLSNIIPLNARLREAYDAINELSKQIEEIKAQLNGQAETVDESVQVIEAPVAETVDTASELDELRKLAGALGLEYDKRWGVKRLRELTDPHNEG